VRKLIFRNFFSPGDIVMLTAAVRDLHCCCPGQFLTDVRTSCPELWEHNCYLTPLEEGGAGVEVLDCSYPLIDRANDLPYHCLHGFMEFLSERLGVRIQPTAFRGDIHLTEQEKSWASQVCEYSGREIPFWLVAAGGKQDVTIKWWERERYQEVVDHFRGQILFVQVGSIGHHHPQLEGVLDLRGRTTLRELVRLVYHAQGVLSPVTALMHMAAAVETWNGAPRPCVVVAGGREPPHWEAYPQHQFIHTAGALKCCAGGGCWRDRTAPLGDGDARDDPENLCLDKVGNLPRCMAMITPEKVIAAVETYFQGGMARYLAEEERTAAMAAISLSRGNDFEHLPLTLENVEKACNSFVDRMPGRPELEGSRGIVICGGGPVYLPGAWVCARMLRFLGCGLPVELWHLGEEECDGAMSLLLGEYGVCTVDGLERARRARIRLAGGWELKAFAALESRFGELLLLDADNVPVINPEILFEFEAYKERGALFWPDYGRLENSDLVWRALGLTSPATPEFESGQFLVDKVRCWEALRLAMWFNEHSDFFYQYLHGDKETFHLAFAKLGCPFMLVPAPIQSLEGTMCQHDPEGNRVFQHRNRLKWKLEENRRVKGFLFEEECLGFLDELNQLFSARGWKLQNLGMK
jgi:hypothetical protein